MQQPVLQAVGVHKAFGPNEVLRGVDFEVAPDELVALVGENGTGKTTLVRCIAGIAPIDAGQLRITSQTVQPGDLATTLSIVWQDLALSDNLDTVANVFLGREGGRLLPNDAAREVQTTRLLGRLGVTVTDPTAPVSLLSGGERQAIALARSMVGSPSLLILDEPTAALDTSGVDAVRRLIETMRARSVAILLISHDMEFVTSVADRALVLRDGRITADVRRPELSPDRLQALVAGLEVDLRAQEHLAGLRSLVDELSEVEPSAVLPLIVSATSVAMELDQVALHLLSRDGNDMSLAAGLGLAESLRAALVSIPPREDDPHWTAIRDQRRQVIPDTRSATDQTTSRLLGTAGIRSMWTVPLIGAEGVMGTLSGYSRVAGPESEAALHLAELYASQAAGTLDRERLLDTVTRRNRTLETLRQLLETLTGPGGADADLETALEILRVGLGADRLALVDVDADGTATRTRTVTETSGDADAMRDEPVALDDGTTLVEQIERGDDRQALVATWGAHPPEPGAAQLLTDGAQSVLLALRRLDHERALLEAMTLRRAHGLQRTFLTRLSHELRTPLTAIQGYAESLQLSDVDWEPATTDRFLGVIAHESQRLGHLVTDMLDSSAVESGGLALQLDWCDVRQVVAAALGAIDRPEVDVTIDAGVPPIRADHDRLEQVLVNLVDNAFTHTPAGTRVTVTATVDSPSHRRGGPAATVVLRVTDDGPGLPSHVDAAHCQPGARGVDSSGSGLGLSIVRGIVDAHAGTLEVTSGPLGTGWQITLPVDGPSDAAPAWSLDDGIEEPA